MTAVKSNVVAIITDDGELKAAILSIKRTGAKLDQMIHVAAVSAVDAFAKHGNVFYINALYQALGKGARHVALTDWYLKYGGVQANTGESKDSTPFIKDANKRADLAGGMIEPWYMCKPSAKPDQVVDVYGLLMKVLTKATKEGAQVEGSEMLEPLKALLEQHRPDAEDELKNSGASNEAEAPL